MSNIINPSVNKQRYIILDFLRGMALLGICLANYPEFGLYTFQKAEVVEEMPTAGIDSIIRFLQYFLVDGKFYTLFSLLFGIGFSIIMANAMEKNRNGMLIFYRRMIILVIIGLCHLVFLWAGDILILYAVLGLLLPLFRNISNKKLLIFSAALLIIPVLIDVLIVLCGLNLSAPVIKATAYFHDKVGITEDNFPVWLLEKNTYSDIVKFNWGGSFIRMQEFIDGNRVFKVLGLFLLGLYIGRKKIYADLNLHMALLKKVRFYGFLIGIPTSLIYAWDAVNGHPLGLAGSSIIYTCSVVPMGLAYICAICIWYSKHNELKIFSVIAAPGKMALTNYIGQSVFGIIIFYGIGFGLALTGLVYIELIALGVFALQVLISMVWLHYFRFGPLEWIWRMFTYGKFFSIRKVNN